MPGPGKPLFPSSHRPPAFLFYCQTPSLFLNSSSRFPRIITRFRFSRPFHSNRRLLVSASKYKQVCSSLWASQVVLMVKSQATNAGHMGRGFDPWVERDWPGGGHGNSLQRSCLENPMDREAWQATVHGVTKSQTWLKSLSIHCLLSSNYRRLNRKLIKILVLQQLTCVQLHSLAKVTNRFSLKSWHNFHNEGRELSPTQSSPKLCDFFPWISHFGNTIYVQIVPFLSQSSVISHLLLTVPVDN